MYVQATWSASNRGQWNNNISRSSLKRAEKNALRLSATLNLISGAELSVGTFYGLLHKKLIRGPAKNKPFFTTFQESFSSFPASNHIRRSTWGRLRWAFRRKRCSPRTRWRFRSTPSSTTGCPTPPCPWPTWRTRITRRGSSRKQPSGIFSARKTFTRFWAIAKVSRARCR